MNRLAKLAIITISLGVYCTVLTIVLLNRISSKQDQFEREFPQAILTWTWRCQQMAKMPTGRTGHLNLQPETIHLRQFLKQFIRWYHDVAPWMERRVGVSQEDVAHLAEKGIRIGGDNDVRFPFAALFYTFSRPLYADLGWKAKYLNIMISEEFTRSLQVGAADQIIIALDK